MVGLGFGMNIYESLEAGKEGILFTLVSVTGVMLVGCLVGRMMGLLPKASLSCSVTISQWAFSASS